MSDVEVIDNTEEVLEALERAKQNALTAIGMEAETYAKKNTPVDTGRLRNSITFVTKKNEGTTRSYNYTVKVDGKKMKITDTTVIGTGAEKDSVYIGTNVEYAPYVELGSRNNKAHHMLQRAAIEHADEYKKLAEQAFKNA